LKADLNSFYDQFNTNVVYSPDQSFDNSDRIRVLPDGPCKSFAASDCSSRDDVLSDLTSNIRQTEVAAGILVGEPFVIEAEEVQDGRVKIMRAHFA